MSTEQILMIAIYLFPSIVAAIRQHHNQNSIFLLNALLGWTIVGWIVALIWAASCVPQEKAPATDQDFMRAIER